MNRMKSSVDKRRPERLTDATGYDKNSEESEFQKRQRSQKFLPEEDLDLKVSRAKFIKTNRETSFRLERF